MAGDQLCTMNERKPHHLHRTPTEAMGLLSIRNGVPDDKNYCHNNDRNNYGSIIVICLKYLRNTPTGECVFIGVSYVYSTYCSSITYD